MSTLWKRRRSACPLSVRIIFLLWIGLIPGALPLAASPVFQRDTNLITLHLSNATLDQAFKEIKRQTSYRVMYANELVEKAKTITVSLDRVSLGAAMTALLNDQPFSYVIDKKNIVIVPKKPDPGKLSVAGPSPDQGLSILPISGIVTDSSGNPLAGATITVRKSRTTVISDASGVFAVEAEMGDELIISFVGYKSQTVFVRDERRLHIRMEPEISGLEQITVFSTGYEDVRKDRATGSYVHIDNELLNRSVSTNVIDRILDVTSGLVDNRNAGGARSNISIRGISSINAKTWPLIVVDGFPYEDDRLSPLAYLQNINPNDIESVTVLKDAAAASIWGVRAGNGVIVITTKKGKYGQKSQIQFRSNIGWGHKPDIGSTRFMSPQETVDFEHSLFERNYYLNVENASINNNYYATPLPPIYELLIAKRDGTIPAADVDARIAALRQHDVREDITKYFMQTSLDQQYALSISGGAANYKYYTSIGYDNNRTNTVGTHNSRWTIRFDNTFKPLKNLEIGGFAVYTSHSGSMNVLSDASFLNPNEINPIYNQLADNFGNSLAIVKGLRLPFVDTASNSGYLDWHYRPLDEPKHSGSYFKQFNNRIGSRIRYTVAPGLSLEVKGQYEKGLSDRSTLHTLKSFSARNLINQYMITTATGQQQYPVPRSDIMDNTISDVTSWNIRNQLNFSRNYGQHDISVVLGSEFRELTADNNGRRKYGFDSNTGIFNTLQDYRTQYTINPDGRSTAAVPNNDYYSGIVNRYSSYFMNGSYSFKNRYIFSLSARKDGANLFGVKSNDRIAPLWSSGFSWKLSEEDFYVARWLPELRLYASYGYSGNIKNDATVYPTIVFMPSSAFTPDYPNAEVRTPPNPQLRWEKVQIANAGIEFATVNKRVGGSIEYYIKKGLDLIGPVSVDPTSGVADYTGNHASIAGHGIDVMVNLHMIAGSVFSWATSWAFNYNTNRVTNYEAEASASALVQNIGTPYIGRPLEALHSYQWAGLSPINGDPMGYVDKEIATYNSVLSTTGGVPNTRPEHVLYHGNSVPVFTGFFINTLKFRQLSLSFNILYRLGHYFRRESVDYRSLYRASITHSDYTIRWQNPGDEKTTNVPSLPASPNTNRDNFYRLSEVLVERADHIRLRDIRVGYDLGSIMLDKLSMHGAQFYAYASNLGIIWRKNRNGIDPEYRTNASIPLPATIAIGFNISF